MHKEETLQDRKYVNTSTNADAKLTVLNSIMVDFEGNKYAFSNVSRNATDVNKYMR